MPIPVTTRPEEWSRPLCPFQSMSRHPVALTASNAFRRFRLSVAPGHTYEQTAVRMLGVDRHHLVVRTEAVADVYRGVALLFHGSIERIPS